MNKLFVLLLSASIVVSSCDTLNDTLEAANEVVGSTNGTAAKDQLTNDEVIKGLKEALTVGTKKAAESAHKVDGFLKNPKIKIPFPPEAQKVKDKVEDLGMEEQVDKFVVTMNRAAEEAASEAVPIFVSAVKNMTIQDGFNILKGEDNAATVYLRNATYEQLFNAFQPKVKEAIAKVDVTKYWNPIITTYNKIPLTEDVNPDLDKYITDSAIDGLFVLLAEEEDKIRENPAARVTDILKKVFGSLDN